MNLSLAHGIGQAASGFARGMQLGDSIVSQRQNREIQKAEHENVQKQRAQLEERNRLMQEWNAAGAKFLDGRRAEALLGGADEKTWKPSHEDLIGAMDARGEAMFKAGRFEDYTENFAKVEQVRSGMRAKATQDALAAYQVSKDPSALVGLLPQYSPGVKAMGAERIPGKDGGAMVRFIYAGPDGKESRSDIDEQELLMTLTRMAANPTEGSKFAFAQSLENFKHLLKVKEGEGAHQRRLQQIDAETEANLRLIGARAAGEKSVDSHKASLGLGGANTIQRTLVDRDGYVVGVRRDGKAERLTDEQGQPILAESLTKRVDALAAHLQKNVPAYRRKPFSEVRAEAERILLEGGGSSSQGPALRLGDRPAGANAALGSGPTTQGLTLGGAQAPAANRPPLSQFER